MNHTETDQLIELDEIINGNAEESENYKYYFEKFILEFTIIYTIFVTNKLMKINPTFVEMLNVNRILD